MKWCQAMAACVQAQLMCLQKASEKQAPGRVCRLRLRTARGLRRAGRERLVLNMRSPAGPWPDAAL